jgi:hypothetical protein
MNLNHPQRGCHCETHERQRTYAREYARNGRGVVTVHRGPARGVFLTERLLIEQAIARGEATSRIMRTLTVSYETVQLVRARLDAAVA